MSNDLLFSILPREGKTPIEQDDLKVKQVEKEAKLRALSDEEKELHAEEREAREKFQKKANQQAKKEESKDKDDTTKSKDPELPTVDEHGRKHLDIYI
jgi:TATA-binding protein-associated factor Taf7